MWNVSRVRSQNGDGRRVESDVNLSCDTDHYRPGPELILSLTDGKRRSSRQTLFQGTYNFSKYSISPHQSPSPWEREAYKKLFVQNISLFPMDHFEYQHQDCKVELMFLFHFEGTEPAAAISSEDQIRSDGRQEAFYRQSTIELLGNNSRYLVWTWQRLLALTLLNINCYVL